jgi:endonuclease/exonuclease/phosphatase family metal-dependent hydrolase
MGGTTQSFKVLTLNTWQKCGPWEERWQAIVQHLEVYQPDVIAFQELFDTEWRDRIAQRTGCPFVAEPPPSSSGLVLLSRLPIVASAVHTFAASSPLETYCRYLLWAELAWRGGNIHVFNTHLSWMPEDNGTRLAQVQEILHYLEAKRDRQPVLLLGDLNAPPESREIRWLLESAKLVDTFAAANPSECGFTWARKNHFTSQQQPNLPDRRIDYILAAGEDLVSGLSSCRLVFDTAGEPGIFPSDHFGVLAEFVLKEQDKDKG